MAGVGKTQLAVHIGHLLARERPFDRVLFVNLRGFHPDPAQPPADPAAVLDGFLRLLGVPGQQIPHDLNARVTVYRARLAGTRTLVVLDNAADTDQARPLLPDTPGCPVVVTSRRSLTDLDGAMHLEVDVFTPDEALAFLTEAVPSIPVGADPYAAARIADRCGHLPLALGLVAAHIHTTPGWTLTDHADRLDEHHHHGRLETGVALALDLSYQHLPTDRQRLLRLLALHPGQDLDPYAAAALAGTDLPTTRAHLSRLRRDHLLQPAAVHGRYTFHDLVRGYAHRRANDEEPPPKRRAALTRLFDFYLAATVAAMDTQQTAEAHLRRRIPAPATPMPDLAAPDTARTWLDTERPTLVAVAAHTAAHGWPTHTTRLSATLYRYLEGGYHTDALAIHSQALHAAQDTNDLARQSDALTNLGMAHLWLGRYQPAADHFAQALALCRQASDPAREARALNNLGCTEQRLGRYQPAADHFAQALALCRQAGDRSGEARALGNLAIVEERLGRYQPAANHQEQDLDLSQQATHRNGEANALTSLGSVEAKQVRHRPATEPLHQALAIYRQLGSRTGEAWTLDSLGTLHTRLGQPAEATAWLQQALAIFLENGDRTGEAYALNGLGEAARASGRPADALAHHTAAYTIATDTADRDQQARAHTGLGHAHHALGNPALARHHYQHALTLFTDIGTPEADQIRVHLAATDDNSSRTRADG